MLCLEQMEWISGIALNTFRLPSNLFTCLTYSSPGSIVKDFRWAMISARRSANDSFISPVFIIDMASQSSHADASHGYFFLARGFELLRISKLILLELQVVFRAVSRHVE